MIPIVNNSPFLKVSREFPEDLTELCVESNKAYTEIATTVNDRTIGIFPKNRPAITGESWFISSGNAKQQTLRQTYTFTAAPTSIITGLTQIPTITRGFGSYTDAAGNQYGLIFGSSTAIPNQLSFWVDKVANNVQIEILSGGGTVPVITKGIVTIEWLAF